MTWVDSEYAGELSVVSAWLAALLPWSVSYLSVLNGSFIAIRFPLVSVRLLLGANVTGEVPLLFAWQAPAHPQAGSVAGTAFTLWFAGTVVLSGALCLSAVYYAREALLEERSPVDPVHLMGGLLTVSGGFLLVATVLLVLPPSVLQATRVLPAGGDAGITVPVGAVIVPALGVALLQTERTDSKEKRENGVEAS